jgi:hypothetical protein
VQREECKEKSFNTNTTRRTRGEEDGKEFWANSIFCKIHLLQQFYKTLILREFWMNIFTLSPIL